MIDPVGFLLTVCSYLLLVFIVVEATYRVLGIRRLVTFASVIVVFYIAFLTWMYSAAPLPTPRAKNTWFEIKNIEALLLNYFYDYSALPTTQQGLLALVDKPTDEPIPENWKPTPDFNGQLPKDPWGREYLYRSPGYSGEYDLYSLGRDGLPGGVEDDSDIGNWMSKPCSVPSTLLNAMIGRRCKP